MQLWPFISAILSLTTSKQRDVLTPAELSRRWNITHDAAKSTLASTTRRLLRSSSAPTLDQRFSTNDKMLRYKRITVPIFTDTFFATSTLGPSLRNFKMVQLFVTDFGFTACQLMKTKSEVPLAFKQFFKKWGAPDVMVMDSAPEQISGESRRLLQHVMSPFIL